MFTVIGSSITIPGSVSVWTFDSRSKVGEFITAKGYAVDHWDIIHISVYESTINSFGPAKLSLQSVEDFYKIGVTRGPELAETKEVPTQKEWPSTSSPTRERLTIAGHMTMPCGC